MNTICKTSSPNTGANKWIQQCSFSIMGAICILFSENNAFCKITLNRKCLCCHFWLLTASSQWDLPQHKTDLAVFADWGPTSPDTWNTDGNISAYTFLTILLIFFNVTCVVGFSKSDVSIIITDYHLVRPFSWFMQIFLDNLLKQQLRGRYFCIFFIIPLVVALKAKYFALSCGFKVAAIWWNKDKCCQWVQQD